MLFTVDAEVRVQAWGQAGVRVGALRSGWTRLDTNCVLWQCGEGRCRLR